MTTTRYFVYISSDYTDELVRQVYPSFEAADQTCKGIPNAYALSETVIRKIVCEYGVGNPNDKTWFLSAVSDLKVYEEEPTHV